MSGLLGKEENRKVQPVTKKPLESGFLVYNKRMSYFQNKNNLFIAFLFLFILSLALVFSISEIKKFEQELEKAFFAQSSYSPEPRVYDSVNLIFVGDVMLDRGVEFAINKYGAGDFKFPFLKIADELRTADLLIGNLEGPISDKGTKVGSIYSFRDDPKAIEGLNYAGFDVLSLANNHAFDYGRLALEDTLKRLKEANINYLGAGLNEKEAFAPVIKEIKGVKISFLAFTDLGSRFWEASASSSGIAWISQDDLEKVKKEIEDAKREADFLIILLHSGEEYQAIPSAFQTKFAKLAVDSGADLVIGHHPHVVQKIEKYKSGYVAYSLGNFIFDQGFSKETMEGLLLRVIIEGKKVKELTPVEVKINKNFQPEILKGDLSG